MLRDGNLFIQVDQGYRSDESGCPDEAEVSTVWLSKSVDLLSRSKAANRPHFASSVGGNADKCLKIRHEISSERRLST